MLWFLHKRGATAAFDHLRCRTTAVDIDELCTLIQRDLAGMHHALDITAKKLHCKRKLVGIGSHHQQGPLAFIP